jgi:hypothetical protein
MYTFWDESTAIQFPIILPYPDKYVYETSAPVELYLRTNVPGTADIGKVFPVVVGVKVIVFIGTDDPEV